MPADAEPRKYLISEVEGRRTVAIHTEHKSPANVIRWSPRGNEIFYRLKRSLGNGIQTQRLL